MLPVEYACPRCKCQACYALHRRGFDWVVSWIGLRPARCLTCGKRFYARYTMANDRQKYDVSTQEDAGTAGQGKRAKSSRVNSRNRFDKAA